MTKDTPSPTGGGGRYSPPKKVQVSPGPALLLDEQRRELEAVRAELEAERARSQAERRRFATEVRELREAGERERQQLADQLRSRWEMQRVRELRQLQEAVLRERDAEVRQLLRWKEAELRQLQQLLHKERDCAVRQARELQRQLAEELLSRGYCSRAGSAAAGLVGANECRCKLQDVLAQLRWETDGEQAARIRHLQAALDVERSLFLKYILENFHWDPASVLSLRPPRPTVARPEPAASAPFQAPGSGELLAPAAPAAATTVTITTAAASASTHTRLGPAPPAASATGSVYRPRPVTPATRPRSLDSLCAPRPRPYSLATPVSAVRSSRSLDGSPSRAESPGAGEPEAGSPLDRSPHYSAVLPHLQLARDNLGTGEKVFCGAPRSGPDDHQLPIEVLSLQKPGKEGEAGQVPSVFAPRQSAGREPQHEAIPELNYNDLMKQNSELAEALETLARHCAGLREENNQLRRGFPESSEKVRRLKVKNAELAVIAKRLEERARKLQETNLRAVSAPVHGESYASLELCRQAFARQRARDLTERTSSMQAKDKQIEELRQECRDLQARVAACQGPAQWLNVNDFDHLLRESQKEVLRLQRQVTLQSFKNPHSQRATSPLLAAQLQSPGQEAAEAQKLKLQLQALEQTLIDRQKCCESLELDVGKAQQRFQEVEGRLEQVLSENSWLAQENSRLQEKAQWLEKVDLENCEMRGKLELVTEERDSAALLSARLQHQASQSEASRYHLEQELQGALSALAAQQGEAQRMQQEQEQMQREHRAALQTLEAQLCQLDLSRTPQGQAAEPGQLLRGKLAKKATCRLESPGLPGSRPPAKKASTQTSALDLTSLRLGFQASSSPEADTGSDTEEVEADSLSQAPEPEDLRSHDSPVSHLVHDSHRVPDSHDSHGSHGPSNLKIFLARYNYDPFAGPNEQPEAELPLTAGEYVYIFGDMDEDGFYAGELMNGQRGLVPSNLVEQISDSEILSLQPPEGSDSCLDSSQKVKSHSESSRPEEGKVTDSLVEASCCSLLPKKPEKGTAGEALDFTGVPCSPKLTLIQQLPQGVVSDWEAPFAPNLYGAMKGYNVCVDSELWQNVEADSQIRAPLDNMDLNGKAYHISVQSVMERGCSNQLQCSFLVGGSFCPAPSPLRLRGLTSTSAEISWHDSHSKYPTKVYLNEQEHSLTEAGACFYTFHNLQPSTRYCARVEVQLPGELSKKDWEMSSSVTFTTPSAGLPDPPLDVLVESHSTPGTLLVSWIPVTIDSAGSSNGVPVTGYAVYAGGQKVTEVPSPTAGNVLVELSQLQQQKLSQEVSVRTMSHYGESLDSVPAQIPCEWLNRARAYRSPQAFPVIHNCEELAPPQAPSTLRVSGPVSQEKSVVGSFGAKARPSLPASCGRDKVIASTQFPEDSFQQGAAQASEGESLSPEDISAPWGPDEAFLLSPLLSSRKESYGLKPAKDGRFGEPRHLADDQIRVEVKNARNAVARLPQVRELLAISPENGPSSDGMALRNRLEAELLKVDALADYNPVADLASLEAEDLDVNMWETRRPSQKKEFRLQKGQTRFSGLKKAVPLPEPSALLYQAPSGKMAKILKASPMMSAPGPWFRAPRSSPLKGKVADDPVRVFVALWDYDPQLMSSNPVAVEEELTFQRGQLLKVWGDQDPDGFYHGECSGRMGYIPGDMVSEVQAEGSDMLKQLLQQGHLPPGVSLDGLLGLSMQPLKFQKSFSMPRVAPLRAQLWHPQTTVAAFDYHAEKNGSLSVTEELPMNAGDVVTVLGSVDDNGFFYGELNQQRGLVPSNLLKPPALNAE